MQPEGPRGHADIRIVANDGEAGERLARQLESAGFAARIAPMDCCLDAAPTLVILMASADSENQIRTLRRQGVKCPLLVIGAPIDGATLLHAGADALLPADASCTETAALLRALVRRSGELPSGEAQVPDASALAHAMALHLTPTEQRILEVLARRPGRVVTRDLIVDTLYAGADAPRSSTVDVFVHGLRRKLDGAVPNLRIETVRGAGFRLAMA